MNYAAIAAQLKAKLEEIPVASIGTVYTRQRYVVNWSQMLDIHVPTGTTLAVFTWMTRDAITPIPERDEAEVAVTAMEQQRWRIIHVRQFEDDDASASEPLFQATCDLIVDKFILLDQIGIATEVHRSEPIRMDSARLAWLGEEALVHIAEFTIQLNVRDITP